MWPRAPIGASARRSARREGKPAQNQALSLPGSSRRQPASKFTTAITITITITTITITITIIIITTAITTTITTADTTTIYYYYYYY